MWNGYLVIVDEIAEEPPIFIVIPYTCGKQAGLWLDLRIFIVIKFTVNYAINIFITRCRCSVCYCCPISFCCKFYIIFYTLDRFCTVSGSTKKSIIST